MLTRTPLRLLLVWAVWLCLLATPSTVRAQASESRGDSDSPGPSAEITEIVIVGDKGDVLGGEDSVSITTFDAESLIALGVQDISDLAAITPNLEINTISASTPTFFIRGVGLNDFASNATGAVAVYQDGVPIASPALQLGQIYDVGGVEVFRGPQATGNQRNASAGVISVFAKRPTGNFESKLRVDYGNYDFVDSEGALALPLNADRSLSTRLSFRYTQRDGIVDNRCGGLPVPTQDACGANPRPQSFPVPAGLPDEANDQKRWAARGLFRFQPPESESDWILNLHGSAIDQDTALGQVVGTFFRDAETRSGFIDPAVSRIYDRQFQRFRDQGLGGPAARIAAYGATLKSVTNDIGRADPFNTSYDLVGQEKLDSFGGSLTGDFVLGPVAVKTITGAEYFDRSRVTDFDFNADPVLNSDSEDDAWQASQSFDLSSEFETLPVSWNAGAYFLTEHLDSETFFLFDFSNEDDLGNAPRNIDQVYEQENYSFAAYANAAWEFADDWTLEAGVRFNYDTKDFEIAVQPFSPNGNPLGNPDPGDESDTWSEPTYSISLSYRPTPTLSIYAKYTRGWKPGVFNSAVLFNAQAQGGGSFGADIRVADPETIDAYEVGFDGNWLDGALSMRAALFYYDYTDYQVFIFRNDFGSPPQFEIINANDALIYGAEIDLFVQPLKGRVPQAFDRLLLEARFSWLESQFLDFTDTDTIIVGMATTRVIDFSGNQLPNAPRFKLSASASWSIDLGDLGRYGTLTPRYDVTYTSDIFFDPSEGRGLPPRPTDIKPQLPKYAIAQKAYFVHDVRLTYALPAGFIEVSGWIRNLTDENYKTYVANAAGAEALLNWIGEPRTYGGSLTMRW